ncbi:hypothetical protein CPB86DRAFT_667035, partial [Serendipita vermifera]
PLPCYLLRLPPEILIVTAKLTAHPGDILSLAYTCKHLYQLLAHKDSEYIWGYARNHMVLIKQLETMPPNKGSPRDSSLAEYIYVNALWVDLPIPPPLPGQTEICLAQTLFGQKICPSCKKEHRDLPRDVVLGLTLC